MSEDEGEVFDRLSILDIKASRNASKRAWDNYNRWLQEIRVEIGFERYVEITESLEYADLVWANIELFDHIDEIHNRPPRIDDMQRTDAMNLKRWQFKRALQQRFFPESEFTEQKIGYDQKEAA